MSKVEHGFNIPQIKKELERQDWESEPDDPGQQSRRVWLGTILGLTPSGKYYQPCACGNLDACPSCKGTGILPVHRKRRTAKKWHKRSNAISAQFKRTCRNVSSDAAHVWLNRQNPKFCVLRTPSCMACGGLGSREAYIDQVWHEKCEEAFEAAGIVFYQDDDYFAVQYRDADDVDDA